MDDVTKGAIQQTPVPIGILLADMGKFNRNKSVLKYLLLHMNTLQKTFAFEFLSTDFDEDILEYGERLQKEGILRREDVLQEKEFIILKDFVQKFADKAIVVGDPKEAKGTELRENEIPAFRRCYQKYLQLSIRGFKISEKEIPERLILVTTAHFDKNFYSLREKGLAILAFGGWKGYLAPPSLVEYILTLILRQSVAMISPSLSGSVHLGTKGCLCDFSQSLDEVRLHVLNGFICRHCSAELEAAGFSQLPDQLVCILKKDWLGKSTEPNTPAGIAANLGYDLFITKGLKA